jgi:hypothetical protein
VLPSDLLDESTFARACNSQNGDRDRFLGCLWLGATGVPRVLLDLQSQPHIWKELIEGSTYANVVELGLLMVTESRPFLSSIRAWT